jgi:hypothetical protein
VNLLRNSLTNPAVLGCKIRCEEGRECMRINAIIHIAILELAKSLALAGITASNIMCF